jgi:hypothetical protein
MCTRRPHQIGRNTPCSPTRPLPRPPVFQDHTEYVHRVGRTARLGQQGRALLFLQPTEAPYLSLLRSCGIAPLELSFGSLQQVRRGIVLVDKVWVWQGLNVGRRRCEHGRCMCDRTRNGHVRHVRSTRCSATSTGRQLVPHLILDAASDRTLPSSSSLTDVVRRLQRLFIRRTHPAFYYISFTCPALPLFV